MVYSTPVQNVDIGRQLQPFLTDFWQNKIINPLRVILALHKMKNLGTLIILIASTTTKI